MKTPTDVYRIPDRQAADLLTLIRPGLGRGDGPVVGLMAPLFRELGDGVEVPMGALLRHLWPGKPAKAANNAFRGFKSRLNGHLQTLERPARLHHPSDNRPVAAKTVWMEWLMTPEEAQSRAIAERLRDEQDFSAARYPDTPPEEFVPPTATLRLPMVTFPRELAAYAQRVAGPAWERLPAEQQKYFAHLGCKLEPIIQVVPVLPSGSPVVGMECLALGPQGESYGQIKGETERVGLDWELVLFLMALAQIKTAEALRSDAKENRGRHAGHLFFSINLEPAMVDSALFGDFIDRYARDNVLFELHETIADARSIHRLGDIHGLRFALDDANAWLNRVAQLKLEQRAEWSKMDAGAFPGQETTEQKRRSPGFRDLMDQLGDGLEPERIIQEIKKYMLAGKPLVIEGLEQDDDFRFLEKHWRENHSQPLYGQGHGVQPDPTWRGWLANLKDFGLDGGFILANPFLADVTRTVLNVLNDAEKKTVQRKMDGPVFRLTVTREGNPHEPLHLTLVDKEAMAWYRGRRDEVMVVEKLDSRLPGHKETLETLPGFLRTWHGRKHYADRTLECAPFGEWYNPDFFVDQEIFESENSPPLDGKTLLSNWLLEKNGPSYCALLGDFGVGKTFLCRMFAAAVIRDSREQPRNQPVPFYLDMRLLPAWKKDRTPRLEEMIETLCDKSGFADLPARAVLSAVNAGHLFLIFDGIDEKSVNMSPTEASAFMDEIRRATPAGGGGKVLMACRTQYFLNRPDEQVKVVGGALRRTRSGHTDSDFRIVYLQPFDEPRIRTYLQNLFSPRAQTVFDFLKTVYNLLDLAKRPFLLFLISQSLAALEKRAATGKTVRAADVYQTVVEEWIRRDEAKHQIFPDVKLAFMQMLAQRLWRDGQRHIHFKGLRTWFQRHLPERLPAFDLGDLGRFDAEMRTTTFLSRDAEGHYGFAHTSFQEFFLAQSLVAALERGDPQPFALPRLNREIIAFILDLIERPQPVADLLRDRLETDYQPKISENCFLIVRAWQKTMPDTAPQPARWQLQGADLAGMDLSGAVLDHFFVNGANLNKTTLTGATIRGDFSDADLAEIEAADADLSDCRFNGATLTVANLAGARLRRADFSAATLASTYLQRSDLTGASFDGAELTFARLGGARLEEKQLAGARLDRCSRPAAPFPPPVPMLFRQQYRSAIQVLSISPPSARTENGSLPQAMTIPSSSGRPAAVD